MAAASAMSTADVLYTLLHSLESRNRADVVCEPEGEVAHRRKGRAPTVVMERTFAGGADLVESERLERTLLGARSSCAGLCPDPKSRFCRTLY